MPHFIANIELHDETPNDNARLDRAMEREGFSRFMVAENNVRYVLPPKRYYINSDDEAEKVMMAVARAAKTVSRSFGSVVTEGPSYWRGLQRAADLPEARLAA